MLLRLSITAIKLETKISLHASAQVANERKWICVNTPPCFCTGTLEKIDFPSGQPTTFLLKKPLSKRELCVSSLLETTRLQFKEYRFTIWHPHSLGRVLWEPSSYVSLKVNCFITTTIQGCELRHFSRITENFPEWNRLFLSPFMVKVERGTEWTRTHTPQKNLSKI